MELMGVTYFSESWERQIIAASVYSRDYSHRRYAGAPGLCSGAITYAEQKSIDADIFVQDFPMESAAASADDVRMALLIIRFEKPREVGEWDRKLAAIGKEHPKIVRVEPKLRCTSFKSRNAHPISS
jgi:hypothetical protein